MNYWCHACYVNCRNRPSTLDRFTYITSSSLASSLFWGRCINLSGLLPILGSVHQFVRPSPYFGVGASICQAFSLFWGRCINLSFSTLSFIVLLISVLLSPSCRFCIAIVSIRILAFLCPPTYIFHVLITTSSFAVLPTCANHVSLASYVVSLVSVTAALIVIPFILS